MLWKMKKRYVIPPPPRKKNEHFFKELDKDRREKKCEYAAFISLPESDIQRAL